MASGHTSPAMEEPYVEVYPRRKNGEPPAGSMRPPLRVRVADLVPFFNRPQRVAAQELGICVTALKRVCRKLGIEHWPHNQGGGGGSAATATGVHMAHSTEGIDGSPATRRDIGSQIHLDDAGTDGETGNESDGLPSSSQTQAFSSRAADFYAQADANQLDIQTHSASYYLFQNRNPSGANMPHFTGSEISEARVTEDTRRHDPQEAGGMFDPAAEACAAPGVAMLDKDPADVLTSVFGDSAPSLARPQIYSPSITHPLSPQPLHQQPHLSPSSHAGSSSWEPVARSHVVPKSGAQATSTDLSSNLAKAPGNVAGSVCVITEASQPYRIVEVNEGWTALCGYKAEEVIGDTMKVLHGPATDRAAAKAGLTERLRSGEMGAALLINYTKDGTPFLNSVRVQPIVPRGGGAVTHHLGFLQDVSDDSEYRSHPLAAQVRELRARLQRESLGARSLRP